MIEKNKESGMMGAEEHEVADYGPDGTTPGKTMLPAEEPVALWVGDLHLATLHSTPEHLDELARGFLLGQGFVADSGDIVAVHQHEREMRIDIQLKAGVEPSSAGLPANRIVFSGCGQASGTVSAERDETGDSTTAIVAAETLRGALETVLRRGELYRKTRGIHSAGLFDLAGESLVFREDIGRHNAGDKVLGWLSRQKLDPVKTFLASSGRISADAVNKTVRFGIPVLVSKGVPTSLAVVNARRLGLTLSSSLGPGRLRLYSHRYRIKA